MIKFNRLGPIGGIAGATASVLAIVSILVFQDNITRFFSTPRAPYQTMTPPPPPDYNARGAWAHWPSEKDFGAADVFYVHSTTYYEKDYWNAPLRQPDAEKKLQSIARPNEAGPFAQIGAVYAPRYRQATLSAFFTHKYDGLEARRFAYQDVAKAFEFFLKYRDEERPLFLVGYGQGGLHVQGLLRDYFKGQDNQIRSQLAAAYIIGQPTPLSFVDSLGPEISICNAAGEFRCIVSYIDFEARFNEEMDRMRHRGLIWSDSGLVPVDNEKLVCINPLTWTSDTSYIGPDRHIGAGSATGIKDGIVPPAVSRALGATCDKGILLVDDPKQEFLRRGNWFGAKWKAQPFNLFYHDLAKNADDRLLALKAQLFEEAQFLDPIDGSVEIESSPINKVPNQ